MPPEAVDLAAIIAALRDPSLYPHHPDSVEVVQTHISYVFLAGDEVYKVKKPVRFSFLDFSTLERRRELCREEVRLNRRLAADVYLGVVAVCPDGRDRLRFGDEDDPTAIEYAVRMRRLPRELQLDHLLEQDAVQPERIADVAIRLSQFHRDAARSANITANGSSDAIWRVLQDNYDNGRRFRGSTLDASDDDAIQAFAREFLARHDDRFRRRQEEGRIRECHGDLHCEHICFTEPLVIFDCIEFNTQFRYIDVASDIAFLAMDLEFHGRNDLAHRLVAAYVENSGDAGITALLPFYQCYRAYVRGKVDSLKSIEPEVTPGERNAAADSARRHFALAYRYTWSARPALVVTCGLSGTGKSVVARALARRTGFTHLSSDVIRKQLAGISPTSRPTAGADRGIYSAAFSERTYATLFTRAAEELANGNGVILDATFQLRRGRDQARAMAQRFGVPVVFAECDCEPDEVRRRLAARQARDDDASDADWHVYLAQRENYEPFADDENAEKDEKDARDEKDDHLRLDTTTASPGLERHIEQALRQRTQHESTPTEPARSSPTTHRS